MKSKICSKCRTEKTLENFQFYNNCYQSWCKSCKNIANKKLKAKNPEQSKKYHREGYRRRKGVTGEYAKGETHSQAKLTEKQVYELNPCLKDRGFAERT